MSEKPTITGESESGRSTNALRKPRPGIFPRTITRPQTIPKTVFTTTAIAVTVRVSLKAETVSGAEIAAHAPSRSSAVRHTIIASGPMRITVR